ncbi:MAG: hypothetical protein ABI382_13430 [Nakamurella sp.]
MQLPHSQPLTRRAILGATGIGVLAAITGCNPFNTSATTITVTAGSTAPALAPQSSKAPLAPQTPTVLLGLVFTTRLHVQNLTTAIATDQRDAKLFTMVLNDRKAHLVALQAEYVRQFGASPSSEAAPPIGTAAATSSGKPAQAADPDEVIGRIRGDATTAQNKFTDALSGASLFQAQLYGSIAACVATHRMVLA